tara:strand:- start:2371 stop:2595 length:225 start_codon:yes stop_codon:yes gene_type:complete
MFILDVPAETDPVVKVPGTIGTASTLKLKLNPSTDTSTFVSHIHVVPDFISTTESASVWPEMLVTKNCFPVSAA